MYDVPVVEVGHEHEADAREDEAGELPVVGPPLLFLQVGPQPVVEGKHQQEGQVRRREVEEEALLVDSWKERDRTFIEPIVRTTRG